MQISTVRVMKNKLDKTFLYQSTTLTLIHAFVASRMDCYISLLFGLPSSEIRKIQIIQNSSARHVTKTRKYDHMTTILQGLHWLPVHQRNELKLICTHIKLFTMLRQYIWTISRVFMLHLGNWVATQQGELG